MLLQEAVNAFSTVTQQALASGRHWAAAGRLPTAAVLISSLQRAGTAFTALMKLMRSHDSNHLVFQAAVRYGGKFVELFLKVCHCS